jgi:hypothetical protein
MVLLCEHQLRTIMATDPNQDRAPAVSDNTLLNRRAKLYTQAALKPVQEAFKNHFKLQTAEGIVAFYSTSVKIDLSTLPESLIDPQKGEKPVRGIHFEYGTKGTAFHPVVQLMFANDGKKGDLELFAQPYEVVENRLVPIDQRTAEGFTSAYRTRIRIDRTANGVFDGMRTGDNGGDPRAEWFPYPDNVNKLIADNIKQQENVSGAPPMKYLVVSCISEKLKYGAMALIEENPEYRHLLVLHTATEAGELLGTTSIPTSGSYAGLAMDLGHLCPPRCKR